MTRRFSQAQTSMVMVVAVVLSGLAGSYFINHSSAATINPNPVGWLDYCTVSGTTTTFHGWAYDPNESSVGSSQPYVNLSLTTAGSHNSIPSSIANYRDSDINTYINSHYSSTSVKPGTYGWATTYNGLYKGTTYKVSGTVLNYGAGANVALGVYQGATSTPGTAGFPNLDVPDACQPARPTPPAPPAPSPAPAPSPSPPASSGSGGTSHRTTTTTTPAAPPAAAAISSDANGVATAGTTLASVKVPAGGASKVHLIYGTDAAILTSSTEDQDSTTGDPTINIDNLDALTTYQFAIVRTASDGSTTTSSPASFKTKGFTISVHFVDGNKKGISGIKGSLDDEKKSKATSDKGGTMSFTDLPGGLYTVTYSYKNKTHTDDFDTSNASVDTSTDGSTKDNTPQVAILSDTVDVTQLDGRLGVGSGEAQHSSKAGTVVLVIFLFLVLVGIIWFILRRRRRAANTSGVLPAPYNPGPAPAMPDIIDQQMNHHANQPKAAPPAVAPAHMGESLREMVIKSMHEEAQKKKQQRPPEQ